MTRSCLIFTALAWLLLTARVSACVDDDVRIAELAVQQGRDDISACVDVLGGCALQDQMGQTLREVCCQTCSDNDVGNGVVETSLPGTDETIQVYLLAGQSECTGQAEATDLDADSQGYPELQGDIPGVWFAGYASPAAADRFFIAPMNAGTDRSMFGPEISFGERMYAVTGKRTLVMKYCVGGSQVFSQWNPEEADNMWDTSADDGSAQWMADNAGLDFNSKTHLFKNMVYTIRKTKEALTNGGVPHEWAGIVWVQGQGDLKWGDWKVFGENTARVWNGFRQHIGSDDVPIIDTGCSTHNQLKSGKEYATQIVKGCKAKNVEFALASNDDTSDCVPGPTETCQDATNMHTNVGPSLYYGYDPRFPEAERLCQGASCKEFNWYRKFPENLHSAYEGMILKGRMLANAFLSEFTSATIPSAFLDEDVARRFPWNRCPDGTLPSDGNFCWIDYRDESVITSSELCNTTSNTGGGTTDDSSATGMMVGQGLGMILGTAIGLFFFV
mmetsp:Transcript_45667/g.110649  ORF Transcript_45667/g.110649 Transcript_45667/m.110649 type:complete len:502 (+) Transcript_45667:19-1524(+)